MPVKPGMNVDLFFDRPPLKWAPLGALVYQVESDRITLCQTSPPLEPSHVGQAVKISFVSVEEGTVRRLGFEAVIAELIRDYRLVSGDMVPAVVLERRGGPEEINLRRNFRVRPPRDSGIEMTIYRNRYEVLDLSLMGLRYRQPARESAPKPTDRLDLRLRLEGRVHAIKARVVRISAMPNPNSRSVAVAFLELRPDIEAVLWKTIFAIDRENLSRRASP